MTKTGPATVQTAAPKRGQGRQSRSAPVGLLLRAGQLARAIGLLRLHGVEYGAWPAFRGRRPQLHIAGSMRVGERFNVRGDQFPAQITVRPGGRLEIGDRCFLNQGANVLAAEHVVIGPDCQIGDLAAIRDTDTHPVEPGKPAKVAPVRLGRNVWVGRGALIMPGVTIGDHAVVAAGAVVTSDVPAATVVVGVPARAVRTFDVPDPEWRRP